MFSKKTVAACIEQREDADRTELKWSEYKPFPRAIDFRISSNCSTCYRLIAARTSPLNSGWGRNGRDKNSG